MRLLLFLILFFAGMPADAADYCIHPSGQQTVLANCPATAGPACSGAATSCTIGTANAGLQAGDRAIIMGGDYGQTKIEPANSGTSENAWITYKAYGDGLAYFREISGGVLNTTAGAVMLSGKDWIRVDGQGVIGTQTEKFIRIEGDINTALTGGLAINVSGAQNIHVRYLRAESCPGSDPDNPVSTNCEQRNLNRIFLSCPVAGGDTFCTDNFGRYTLYIYGEHLDLWGNAHNVPDNLDKMQTEDGVALQGETQYIILDDINMEAPIDHSSMTNRGSRTKYQVYRRIRIDNPYKTAWEIYKGNRLERPLQEMHVLVEDSYFASAAYTNPSTNPGADRGTTCKGGGSDVIFRHNVCARADMWAADVDARSVDLSSRTDSGNESVNTNWRIQGSTIIDNANSGIVIRSESGSPTDIEIGSHRMLNSVIYDSYRPSSTAWPEVYIRRGTASFTLANQDIFRRNLFGRTGGAATTKSFSIEDYGQRDLAYVKTLPDPYPQFADWSAGGQTFENEWINSRSLFQDYANYNYDMVQGNQYIDTGAPNTYVTNVVSGTVLEVEDSRWFYAEVDQYPQWMRTAAGFDWDWICVGPDASNYQAAGTDCIQLAGVDDSTNRLTLATSISANVNDVVWLYRNSSGRQVLQGSQPDIGHVEYGTATLCPFPAADGPYNWNAAICLGSAQAGELWVGDSALGPFNAACGAWSTSDCSYDATGCGPAYPFRCSVVLGGMARQTPYYYQWQVPPGSILQTELAPRQLP